MDVKTTKYSGDPDIAILRVNGALDSFTNTILQDEGLILLNMGYSKLVISLKNVHHIGASTLKMLQQAEETTKRLGGWLRICEVPEKIRWKVLVGFPVLYGTAATAIQGRASQVSEKFIDPYAPTVVKDD